MGGRRIRASNTRTPSCRRRARWKGPEPGKSNGLGAGDNALNEGGGVIKRATWLDLIGASGETGKALPKQVREALAALDDALFEIWNLGENVLLAWTRDKRGMQLLAVRHYVLAQAVGPGAGSAPLINEVLAGPKFLPGETFERVCAVTGWAPRRLPDGVGTGPGLDTNLVNNLVRRYGVSLVRDRAVVLLDAVKFSLHPPLEQMAMLNSLSFSVNSAYRQLLSKDIQVNFARTTTGDGFYIWNRVKSMDANIALYKLMMMVLADNAVAQRKSQGDLVPKLRAAFHIGEHYEFHQVEALNPTTFSYIVGQVTIDLSRMIEKALPGQILLGDFSVSTNGDASGDARYDTLDFVEQTAATLDDLHGLMVSGDRVDNIRCYLTGQSASSGRFPVHRYRIRDKHGTDRSVYNAKINIHREQADPIYLGTQREELGDFSAVSVEVVERGPTPP